jgi:hypothetical protein
MNELRTILLSAPALAVAMLFSACITEEPPVLPAGTETQAVEVPVAPLGEVSVADYTDGGQTRAVLNTFNNTEIYVAYGESAAGNYVPDPNYHKALGAIVQNGLTIFDKLLFYPSGFSASNYLYYNNIYLKGFYPRQNVVDFVGNNAESRTIIANQIHYEIDGTQDICFSSLVKGSNNDRIYDQYLHDYPNGPVSENARLRFQHMLSHLVITVKRTVPYSQTGAALTPAWPTQLKLTRAWITDLSTRATLNLNKTPTDSDALVFEEPHNKTIELYSNDSGLVWPSDASSSSEIGNLMIEAEAGFKIILELNTGDIITVDEITIGGLTINVEGDNGDAYHDIIRRGNKYNISIQFNPSIISAIASVEPWNDIPVGNEEVWW